MKKFLFQQCNELSEEEAKLVEEIDEKSRFETYEEHDPRRPELAFVSWARMIFDQNKNDLRPGSYNEINAIFLSLKAQIEYGKDLQVAKEQFSAMLESPSRRHRGR